VKRTYVILLDRVSETSAREALVADGSPWRDLTLSVTNEDVDASLSRAVFHAPGSMVEVSLVADGTAETNYLLIEGFDAATVAALEAAARRALPVASPAEIRQDTALRYRSRPSTLIRLALAAGAEADAPSLGLFAAALCDDDAAVRRAAIEAIGLTQWQAAFALLREREAFDPDAELRAFARRVRDSLSLAVTENDHAQ
jgi:hypothetical protein